MVPALQPGDRLAALRLPRLLPRWIRYQFVRPGAVVVVRDPRGGGRILVKRVATVGAGGSHMPRVCRMDAATDPKILAEQVENVLRQAFPSLAGGA